ncbi:hypothetical protein ACJJTC_005731 [Scirpophaga incertulas]
MENKAHEYPSGAASYYLAMVMLGEKLDGCINEARVTRLVMMDKASILNLQRDSYSLNKGNSYNCSNIATLSASGKEEYKQNQPDTKGRNIPVNLKESEGNLAHATFFRDNKIQLRHFTSRSNKEDGASNLFWPITGGVVFLKQPMVGRG